MSRIVYVNGKWVAEEEATLSIFDRSALFADSVYEVTTFINGELLDFDAHMERLQSSLVKLDMRYHVDKQALQTIHHDIITKNKLVTGSVYLQISRGAVDRDFHYDNSVKPTLFLFTQTGVQKNLEQMKLFRVITMPEQRWARRDIKTTQLLASSLAKTKARDSGVHDAVYVENGMVTEATSANFHIVDKSGALITRPLDGTLLPGITRARMLLLASGNGVAVEERPFTPQEVYGAAEACISSATNFIAPVVEVDGRMIGDGKMGPVVEKLRALYLEQVPRS
ncbi:MAG: D-amino-acid transaminase [Candidatus Tokpelaia hoelldobleri]|uniref:Probable branched-chain-amino-acid aminotransferase n=1 Tax=Candidatus Tokpelaia hoelldobleri TaxID=1902579 RepID=A0A1U9JWX2_9HYPH|nr:MAG: D-amino-acid transaminase [Candidatus Tokpelaia hoelldoblerii]